MPKDPVANLLRARGYRFIVSKQYEEALHCFQTALGINPQISVAFRDEEEMENFIREGGREKFIRQQKEQEEKSQREIEDSRLWWAQNEAKLRQEREVLRQEREALSRKRQEESQRLAFNANLSQLISEVEYCADEKPCPKCNELDVLILLISPNARSLLVRCKHCQHEYRIKMEPEEPQKIVDLLINSYMKEMQFLIQRIHFLYGRWK